MPSTPCILDTDGNPLRVGDHVRRRRLNVKSWIDDEFRGCHWKPEHGWVVSTRAMPYLPLLPGYEGHTYRCPDLRRRSNQKEGSSQ